METQMIVGNELAAELAELQAVRARVLAEQEALHDRTEAMVLKLRPRFAVRLVASWLDISPARVSQIELRASRAGDA